ncbi:class I SAM-dependent methyltransferase [Nonomuraea africana]|uniref:SAM-dependent methyltransferase n=1 Tax=Nonomuraea africana TaxID=46171 RepID=A0ABR9KWD5_9ACTN|nr:methyltransferase domain-containing protein [Nonomuraea africana]MBE1566342.1 SAM-dependent methyltransferase [Nonomuraea africana]
MNWNFVRGHLPPAPARVIEIGCGPLGGFVPDLLSAGYDAAGVDPDAPEGRPYHRMEFEAYEPDAPADAVVACTSLHHVRDLDEVFGKVAGALKPDGGFVVVEWARELFDEDTARWCFSRLPDDGDDTWLHRHRDGWTASGEPWAAYVGDWAAREGLHTGAELEAALGRWFEPLRFERGPYFFTEEDGGAAERAAIAAGLIRATGIRYAGRPLRR